MWWIRAVPGAFPERKMDISSLFISMGLSGTGSALHGRRNTGCAGAGSPFGMGQRDLGFLWHPRQDLVCFQLELASLSKQNELSELHTSAAVPTWNIAGSVSL